MAKLYRFVKLNDRFNAQIFTFLLPGKIVREFTPDCYAKDFVYGYQRWAVSFVRSDRHIGAFLKLQTTTQGIKCRLDFAFTVLNKDHFTKNEHFIEKSCEFSHESNVFGRKTFIEIDDLLQRGFVQEFGDVLIELEMRNVVCLYECYIKLPKENHSSKQGYGDRLESTYFSFGLFDWSVSLFPDTSSVEADGSVAVQLQRHTNFDHLNNVRYRVILGDEGMFDSGEMEQVLDISGFGEPFTVGASVARLSRGRSTLRIKVEMVSVVSVSEVTMHGLNRNTCRAHLYDRDKQAWMLEADTSGKYLTFKLYYTDISHVPRKFSRYVAWNVKVISQNTSKPVKAQDGPFCKYYVQQDLDDGVQAKTDIPVDELVDPDSVYLDPEERKLTVQIDWVDSHLLVQPTYNSLDDVPRIHKQQMWREIMALQAENYALEKQLYSYQQSIARNHSKRRADSEPGLRERRPQS
ncbi:uncharacterized protein LOC121388875 [Gigantopelta aegis]|uniref:uncharacterized protein LOC121388875 n=1 Tax=Gigantopelta aegis TaxID=1735272 RepID=UPI001B88A69F|nr:uncharacterized protein LOC121388875 [Gigantopelta aegis]